MSDSWKMPLDEVHVSVRPEELDTILGLRSTFDYFEVLGDYVPLYLEGGWLVKLVIPHLDIALDFDFGQAREVLHQRLTDLAMKGLQACLMVFTGAVSNLMVLEVRGKNAEKALAFGRDWRARCVMQAGEEKELHFYTLPQGLVLPSQTFVETFNLLVYGEGGKVALPPALIPEDLEKMRWLTPPWEHPPAPASPRLLDFLQGHIPSELSGMRPAEPEIPDWEEVFRHIAANAALMQTLLTPVNESDRYYRTLLAEAQAAGLQDRRLLLGLLWHAPLGSARQEPNGLEWLKNLLREGDMANDREEMANIPPVQKQLADMIQELSRTLAGLHKERENLLEGAFRTSASWEGTEPAQFAQPAGTNQTEKFTQQPGAATTKPSMFVVQPAVFPQGEIPVNRKQYEAMIYELGRLGAVEKFNNRFLREANSVKGKIEAHRREEIDHLRQLVQAKKNKRWW